MNKYDVLKKLISDPETLVVPDAYDGISARMIEYCGFKAVQCSGYSFSISKKLIDEKQVSFEENIYKTREIVDSVGIPVMADGEDGYGSRDIFRNNIIKFIKTGIAGINIEDQNLWNPYSSEKIVPLNIMTDKIREVIRIKNELDIPNFLLNARTDALRSTDNRNEALAIAIERGNTYLELGADLCFITYIKTKDEVQLLKKEIHGPISIAAGLPYNINEFSVKDCKEIGVARVSLPSILIFGAIQSMRNILDEIASGTFESIIENQRLLNIDILQKLLE